MSVSARFTSMNPPSSATIAMPWAAVSKALRKWSGASRRAGASPTMTSLPRLSDLGKGRPLALRAAHRQVADRIVDQLAVEMRRSFLESAGRDDLVDQEFGLVVGKL